MGSISATDLRNADMMAAGSPLARTATCIARTATLKMAVATPMPSPKVSTTTTVKPGALASMYTLSFASSHASSSHRQHQESGLHLQIAVDFTELHTAAGI
jgi:hypothetical protein